MFDTNSWQSHSSYKTNYYNMKARYHFGDDVHSNYWDIYNMLFLLNLDPVGDFFKSHFYSTGRPARHQAQILRSMILFSLLLNKTSARTSLTRWVNKTLPNNMIFIALIGCSSKNDLPPLGSYYDLMNRLWDGDRDRYKRCSLFPSGKNSKPQKNIGSDGKLAEVPSPAFSTARLVNRMQEGLPTTEHLDSSLQKLLYIAGIIPSIRYGLIPSDGLTISGDGTAVPSRTSPFGHKIRHAADGVNIPSDNLRHFSDPDADFGWDSSKKDAFFGHTLYMLCYRNPLFKVELPLTMRYTSARRHDSGNFLYAFDEFLSVCKLSPANICLDSAHDNIPTYELLDILGINALIDINGRASHSTGTPEDITLDKQAHPICRGDHPMHFHSYDPCKSADKYRCPLKCGDISSCPYEEQCSPSSYGRTVYIKRNSDLRFHTKIPRDSEEYIRIYKERTACERVNARVLNDYLLQSLRIRGIDRFSFWTVIIGICIHMEARYKASFYYMRR